jgi:hypothetical protein
MEAVSGQRDRTAVREERFGSTAVPWFDGTAKDSRWAGAQPQRRSREIAVDLPPMQYAAEFDYAPGRIDQQADAVLPDADLITLRMPP